MKTLGRHLILELYDCDRALIDDLAVVERCLRKAAERVGATVMAAQFHRYCPQGVSGTLLIAESHLSIHTWPEHGYVAADIFTCGGLDPRPGFEVLALELRAGQHRLQEIVRGLPDEIAAGRSILPADVTVTLRESGSGSPG
ncbi:MAG: adenosylmethionine decarboxylase [Myxococcales bacterium]|nr:adenosylmethionine decarboxylase [Myxococcales bacterium]